ncbi:unnamed protein product [Didymodactylos carnosus]|uniref:ATPase AAA-type core domain-containing protein n=1 Tax=Didymodactylos carnosus TaxID=1234261 RepID=A0A814M6Y2_9BILA|nr:unnamed protein product [Didymodactylos carnosus]CAF1075228.1 unnamed protein product [Didymodactylos carnosus]CAF3780678.1 unnamed protein product [Didymodactylos carnosus]CAF3841859.1 unnamed protein product [Didymodactylos carnosus]
MESENVVRFLFELAREKEPCIVFIDEIDALFMTASIHNKSVQQMKIEFLEQMERMDCHLSRMHFEKLIYILLPDLQAHLNLFKFYIQPDTRHTIEDNDWKILAEKSESYFGADINLLVREVGYDGRVIDAETQCFEARIKTV